jgi:hypothetical protein
VFVSFFFFFHSVPTVGFCLPPLFICVAPQHHSLIRVVNQDNGRVLYSGLQKAREMLQLQEHFAILLDLQTRGLAGLEDSLDETFRQRLRRWAKGRNEDYSVMQYSDLLDLPCVLILCEKGKMGDTFPRSLRYYDLRLRYTNSISQRACMEQVPPALPTYSICCEIQKLTEWAPRSSCLPAFDWQDLGRACRYTTVADKMYPLPLVLVSEMCQNNLTKKRRGRQGLLRLEPDHNDKMFKVCLWDADKQVSVVAEKG